MWDESSVKSNSIREGERGGDEVGSRQERGNKQVSENVWGGGEPEGTRSSVSVS